MHYFQINEHKSLWAGHMHSERCFTLCPCAPFNCPNTQTAVDASQCDPQGERVHIFIFKLFFLFLNLLFFFPLANISAHTHSHTQTHKSSPRDTCQPVSPLAQAGTSTPVWWGTAALPRLLTGGCGLATHPPVMTQVALPSFFLFPLDG